MEAKIYPHKRTTFPCPGLEGKTSQAGGTERRAPGPVIEAACEDVRADGDGGGSAGPRPKWEPEPEVRVKASGPSPNSGGKLRKEGL